jgi:hypothetical protein
MSCQEQFEHGLEVLQAIDGEAGQKVIASLTDISPELGHQVVAWAFGEIALVLAVLNRCHDELTRALDDAEAASDDPAAQLRARVLVLGAWAYQHPGLYKVLHESTLNQRTAMPFKQELAERTTAVIQRCMDAGLAPADEAAAIALALDLRTAIHGAVSMRLNQPDRSWPPLEEQVERFLTKLVGIPSSGLLSGPSAPAGR